MLDIILKYAKQPSTWRGFIAIATGAGLYISPDQVTAIVTAAVALAGVIEVFTDEDKKVK